MVSLPRPRAVLAATAVAALASSLMVAGPAQAVPNANTSSKLTKAVTVEGVLEHLRALEEIGDENGGYRASGTAGYDLSVEYVVQRLLAAGYTPEIQEFEFPFYQEVSPAHLERVSPTATTYTEGVDFTTMEYSGAGDLTGTVQPVDIMLAMPRSSTSGCEAADFAGFVPGNIALIQRGTCTYAQKAANAADAGAVGVIIFNQGNSPDREGIPAATLGGPTELPVVATTFALGADLAAAGTVVHLVTDTFSEVRTTYNVIAQTDAGRTDQVVMAGAHLDSTLDGVAINDDGSGSAVLLEIAEQMAKTKPNNAVRFAWFGAEENGLLGSEYYVNTRTEEQLDAIKAYLNFDMLGSSNYARFVYDGDDAPEGSNYLQSVFEDYLGSRGLPTSESDLTGSSDYAPFAAVGIPVGGVFAGAGGIKTPEEQALYGGTAGQPYAPEYHTADDRVAAINTTILDQFADAAAHAIITLAYDLTALGGERVPGKSHGAAQPASAQFRQGAPA